jgi:hypothetical protein
LTPQELQIAELAASGLSNKQIGVRLYLSHADDDALQAQQWRDRWAGARPRRSPGPSAGCGPAADARIAKLRRAARSPGVMTCRAGRAGRSSVGPYSADASPSLSSRPAGDCPSREEREKKQGLPPHAVKDLLYRQLDEQSGSQHARPCHRLLPKDFDGDAGTVAAGAVWRFSMYRAIRASASRLDCSKAAGTCLCMAELCAGGSAPVC